MLNCSPRVLDKLLSRLKALDYSGYAEQYPPLGAWPAAAFAPAQLTAFWRDSLRSGAEPGLFVNVPFCVRKCDFCFLPVTATGPGEPAIRRLFSDYFQALRLEAELFRKVFAGRRFGTLYVGGGTPSLMTPGEIAGFFSLLRSMFSLSPQAQITTEIHPGTADLAHLRAFRAAGVNWLCIGAQSFSEAVLRRSRREQRLGSAARALALAREAGIRGVNIDLICGLPGQTGDGFLEDVEAVAALRPEAVHLNTFVVTPFTNYARRGGRQPQQERVERLKELGFQLLAEKGYRKLHYDSAGLGPASRNFQTSDLKEKRSVLGLGPGAVSHAWGAARYINTVSFKEYRSRLLAGSAPVDRGCAVSRRDEMVYYALEALSNEPHRLDYRKFRRLFGAGPRGPLGAELKALAAAGLKTGKDYTQAGPTHWNLLRGTFYSPAVLLSLAAKR